MRDLAKSTAFLERLGWRRSVRGAEGASFFQCGSIALSLFPRSELAKDAGILDDGAWNPDFPLDATGAVQLPD